MNNGLKILFWTVAILAVIALFLFFRNGKRNGKVQAQTHRENPDGTKTIVTQYVDRTYLIANYDPYYKPLSVYRGGNYYRIRVGSPCEVVCRKEDGTYARCQGHVRRDGKCGGIEAACCPDGSRITKTIYTYHI